MSCPTSIIRACDFPQFLVDQTPKFDEEIMEDIRPTDGWLLNVATGTTPMGTPVEITQDRFRAVYPDVTQPWARATANGAGCAGNPCDPPEASIGWGADRLTYYAERQNWVTPLICYDEDMHITKANEHIDQIISEILRPATTSISSNFLRRRHLLWSKVKNVANANCGYAGTDGVFTYQWVNDANGREVYFDCSAAPGRVFKLVPQMLQNKFEPLMRKGYAGKNPFKETSPFIELVSDIDTTHSLSHLGGQQGVGGANNPNVLGNWRFENFDATGKYWRYGFSGQIGNYMVRVDPMGLRFNYVGDLGSSAHGGNGNRYRYQVVLPYKNGVTTGAGGAAGIGSDDNSDYSRAHFTLSQIHHKKGMELLVPDAGQLNSEMPFAHRDFGGKWKFLMHDLGADVNGTAITNKWGNKGQFGAEFQYYVRPLNYEFMEVFFHKREQNCVPEIDTCSADPGYPIQTYSSELPNCPAPSGTYGTGVPTGTQDGPIL